MAEAKPSPAHGSLRWAWTRARSHVGRFLVSGVILGVLTAVANTFLVVPPDASLSERAAYTVVAFLGAVLVTLIAAFVWAFIRAPYEQRDALRRALATAQGETQALIDRRKRLRTDLNL